MTDMDLVFQALAERGVWHGSTDGDAELVRVEIRPAAREAGGSRSAPSSTVSGDRTPARLHARRLAGARAVVGAAIHAHESGAMGAVVMQALDRLLRNDDAG